MEAEEVKSYVDFFVKKMSVQKLIQVRLLGLTTVVNISYDLLDYIFYVVQNCLIQAHPNYFCIKHQSIKLKTLT